MPQIITAERLLEFGGLQDDPERELLGVKRVVRTVDGKFVVATAKPVAVRVFTAQGGFERAIGRMGEGPGEYRYGVDLGVVTADSALVVSYGTRRWMQFTLAGALVREFPVDEAHPIPGGVTLQHGFYSRQRIVGSRGCPSTVLLDRHAPTRPLQFAEALTDAQGRTWRQDVSVPGLWHIHTPDGVHRFDLRLPAGLTIHQFAGDQLVGVITDDDDANRVAVYRVRLPAITGPAPTPCAFPLPNREGVFRNLMIHSRNAMTGGEAFRSDRKRYPASVEEMVGLLNVTEEAEMRILHGSEDSWAFAISHLETGAVCVTSMGPRGLPGWESGTIACSTTGGNRRGR